jgi:glycoprotease/Kae1 family metallohydrolase
VGIVDSECNILANEKHSVFTEKGGLIPRELAEHHYNFAEIVLENALSKAGIKLNEIDVIAFAKGPGIGNALQVGAVVARTLSLLLEKPLIGVNHCIAHIEIGRKTCNCFDPIIVYVSGANTQIIGFENGKYRVFGETLDIGLGNLLDSFGRELGIGFPAGPKIDEMYFKAKNFVRLPYTVKGMDLAFSGLFTAAVKKIGSCSDIDLAYSLMHTSFAMLSEVTERALAYSEKEEVLLTGGVAASNALRKMLSQMCLERNARFFVPVKELCVDNGAQIAWLGLLMFESGERHSISESSVKQSFRVEEVRVSWR